MARIRHLLLLATALTAPMADGWGAAAQPAPLHLQLKPDAVMHGRYVTLADIAMVDTADARLKSLAENLRVARAPQIGYVERLSRAELDQLIFPRLLSAGVRAQWSGAGAVKVQSVGRTVAAAPLVEAAKQYLLKELGTRLQSVAVDVAAPVADLELPAGELAFKPRTIDLKHVYPQLPVWVEVYVDGAAYRTVKVPFNVRGSQPVFAARRDLAEGSVVSAADFELKNEEVAALPHDPVSQFQGPVRLRKPLQAGQAATQAHLSQPGMVFRGDEVKLVVTHGSVVLETRAQAQQDAALGQALRVKAGNGMDAVTARVVAAGVVQAEGM